MCRIVGLIAKHKIKKELVISMRDTLVKGGPDAAAIYLNPEKTVAFGHRRLSILDLSDAGIQPMIWNDWVICYNGEIYNFKEVRAKLVDYHFTTETDTEVIIKAFDKWGYQAVQHFRGMFAFALYNQKTKKIVLCRDRVGVKPLYWYQKDGLFMFASELKAFHEHQDFDKAIDFLAVSLFLQQGYIQSPHSIFKYVKKVKPGSFLEIDEQQQVKEISYWDIEQVYKHKTPEPTSEEEAIEKLTPILAESFQLRMVADVPVGMFLSGGIDSSLVTSILQKSSNQQLKTFTIGFDNEKYNEGVHAKAVAQHIGTNHTELYCREADFKELIPKLPDFYDEPVGAGSSIPTYLVAKLAKQQVKVSLSADGGDEIFGGYTKYEIANKYFSKLNSVPRPVRQLMAHTLAPISPNFVDKKLSNLPFFNNYTNIGTKYFKFKNALLANNLTDFFNISSSFISKKELLKLFPVFQDRIAISAVPKKNQQLGFLGMIDFKTFMEGEVMVKVDRATMNVALEGREPFLDQNIIEFGLGLADNLKIRGGQTKYILRKILYKYVPKELIERPKQGFDIPMRAWTNGFLKEEIIAMSLDADFIREFRFKGDRLQQLITDYFLNRSTIDPHFVWYLYVLYKWYNRWIKV